MTNSDFMPLVELKNADIFQQNSLILNKVSFTIKASEFVYLIGPTGSGKSSLLKTLYADLPLKNGQAEVVDYQLLNIKQSIVPYLRRKIGIVFQDFQLLTDRSVYENLEFVLFATGWNNKLQIKERIEETLTKVNMQDHIYKMPFELSGGELQRICIGRALLNKPKLILADEPTGNLDPATTDNILTLIHDLCTDGCAVLMATHEHNLLERFPAKILKCNDGQLTVIDQQK
ncbi:MAG: ATP-binding cassette domain-containing protein [Bacteroidota bacterium]|nr:ATP-binding cassette domain-containing protein [Bacteroidota bacterium]MEE3037223.1 ATP-binding cassette domain-containing protein [Bacteroidota bacterium]